MMPTDFATHLTAFLTTYMAGQRGASPNTIRSYRDTFVLFLRYLRDAHGRPAEKVTLANMDTPVVIAFLQHLQTARCGHPFPVSCAGRTTAQSAGRYTRRPRGGLVQYHHETRSASFTPFQSVTRPIHAQKPPSPSQARGQPVQPSSDG